MTRKHTPRRHVVPLPPRGLRPRLAPDQVRDCGLLHIEHLDAVASGEATVDTLLDLARDVLTWTKAAQLLGRGEAEMLEQMLLVTRMAERFACTGQVRFDQPAEYELAKTGVQVMDELAELVDRPSAIAAATWSEQQVQKLFLAVADTGAAA